MLHTDDNNAIDTMSLAEILHYRRAVRHFDAQRPLDPKVVHQCLREAQLAPTSSNLQLWEVHHITTPEIKSKLAKACLGQLAATSADQFVVFVVRHDKARDHARRALAFEMSNVERHSPESRWEHRKQRYQAYYGKLIPFLYARAGGLIGIVRKLLVSVIGLSRPILRTVSEADVQAENHKSCMLIAQTFMVAMAEKRYDTCPIGGFDAHHISRLLDLPRGAEVSLVISCGIRAQDRVWGDRFRLPFEEIYHQH